MGGVAHNEIHFLFVCVCVCWIWIEEGDGVGMRRWTEEEGGSGSRRPFVSLICRVARGAGQHPSLPSTQKQLVVDCRICGDLHYVGSFIQRVLELHLTC